MCHDAELAFPPHAEGAEMLLRTKDWAGESTPDARTSMNEEEFGTGHGQTCVLRQNIISYLPLLYVVPLFIFKINTSKYFIYMYIYHDYHPFSVD